MDYEQFNVHQIKMLLQKRGLKTSGNKRELILRLQQFDGSDVPEVGAINAELEELSQEPVVLPNANEISVSKLRDDVSGLQRSMEILTQQLQTIINSPRFGGEALSVEILRNDGDAVAGQHTFTRTVTSQASGISSNGLRCSPNLAPTSGVYSRGQNVQTTTAVDSSNMSAVGGSRFESNQSSMFEATRRETAGNADLQSASELRQNVSTTQNMREVIAILPEYDPCDDSMTSVQFINRIEQLKSAYGWNDNLLLFAIQSKMKGITKSWIDAQPIFRVWSDFVSAFLLDFPSEINIADIHIELMQTRLGRDESVIAYYYKMLSLGRRGNLDDKAIVTYIINGLTDEHLRKTLSTRYFAKCADLLTALNNAHTIQRKITTGEVLRTGKCNTSSLKQNNNGQREVNKENVNKGFVCFNCRERGHMAKHCPKPKRVHIDDCYDDAANGSTQIGESASLPEDE